MDDLVSTDGEAKGTPFATVLMVVAAITPTMLLVSLVSCPHERRDNICPQHQFSLGSNR